MRPAIILFAKAPVAGKVKTRLQASLGVAATLELHSAFVLDMLEQVFERVDVFEQFGFRRQDVGVLEHVVADAKFFRHPTQIFQFERLPLAGKVVEFAFALGFENPLFGNSLKQGNCAGWLCGALHSQP